MFVELMVAIIIVAIVGGTLASALMFFYDSYFQISRDREAVAVAEVLQSEERTRVVVCVPDMRRHDRVPVSD